MNLREIQQYYSNNSRKLVCNDNTMTHKRICIYANVCTTRCVYTLTLTFISIMCGFEQYSMRNLVCIEFEYILLKFMVGIWFSHHSFSIVFPINICIYGIIYRGMSMFPKVHNLLDKTQNPEPMLVSCLFSHLRVDRYQGQFIIMIIMNDSIEMSALSQRKPLTSGGSTRNVTLPICVNTFAYCISDVRCDIITYTTNAHKLSFASQHIRVLSTIVAAHRQCASGLYCTEPATTPTNRPCPKNNCFTPIVKWQMGNKEHTPSETNNARGGKIMRCGDDTFVANMFVSLTPFRSHTFYSVHLLCTIVVLKLEEQVRSIYERYFYRYMICRTL